MIHPLRSTDKTLKSQKTGLNKIVIEIAIKLFENDINELIPDIGGSPKHLYPIIGELSSKYGIRAETLLSETVKEGLLEREVYDKYVSCPKCGGFHFMLKFLCPSCGSTNVERLTLFSHVPCGYIGVLEEAREGGKYVCPRCKKPLGVMGKDWIKIGSTFRCKDCGASFHVPGTKFKCIDCGGEFSYNEVVYKKIYKYIVNVQKVKEMYNEYLLSRIEKYLVKNGYKVRRNENIKGLSGIPHAVPLFAEKNSSNSIAVHTVIAEGGEEASAKILGIYGVALDTPYVQHLILGVKIMASPEGNIQNVKLIKGNNADEILQKLTEYVG